MHEPSRSQKKVAIIMADMKVMKHVIEDSLLEGNAKVTAANDLLEQKSDEDLDKCYKIAVEALNTMAKSGKRLRRSL